MKKIALISDGWKRLVTYSWVDGIMMGARENNDEICLCQFNTNGNWSHDKKQNEGEYNLYNLPNYDEYDGIVFDCTNTTDPDQIDSIVNRLRSINKPVVSISYYIEGFHFVGINNKQLFCELIDHLYYEHGCRDFVFAGGPAYNFDNRMRFSAFEESMKKYGIPLTEDMYMFGDFDFGTGVRYMEEWIAAKKPLPGAFVCANDNIAAGICSVACQHGYKIPEDFLITGCDNLDKAAYYNPQITTVEHNRGNIGKTAYRILRDIWDGKDVDDYTYLGSECIWGESCGCPNSGRVDYRNYIKWQIEYSVKKDEFEESVMALENQITECNNYDSLFSEFARFIENLGCDGVYIVVDDLLENAKLDAVFSNTNYDRSRMHVGYADEGNKLLTDIKTVDELDAHMNEDGNDCAYMFTSIHFRNQIVGYTVLKNPEFLYNNSSFYDIHSVFVVKLENLFKQKQLENMNETLMEIYNKDMLTGLYNRVAYTEMIVPKFEELREKGIKCAMIFFDADNFKIINDTKGHKFGDLVLKKIANIINENKPEDGLAYRFGGDEFVVFFPDATDYKIYEFVNGVNKKFDEEAIEVSLGVILTDPNSNKSLEEYLVNADEEMYKIKSRRKKNRAFYKGMDISSLPEYLDNDGKFYTADGREIEAFDLLEANNVNSVRLRIWNNPSLYPDLKGYCDLEKTLVMARKIKERNMHFVLDFHYSDYWADPGKQKKPQAWENLSFEELKMAVYRYTKHVLDELDAINCLPDMVQVGNEIRSGMLFPEGAVPNYGQLAELLNAGIKACRDKSKDIEVMIHLDQGGRYYSLRDWFDTMFEAGLNSIDAIGISYYSFWHGTYMDLRDTMKQLILRYDLPVYVVETAHPWRQCEKEHVSAALMKTAGLPAGIEEQKRSLEIIMQIAANVSGKKSSGLYYWEPLCVPDMMSWTWGENMGMLDETGHALASFEAYKNFSLDTPAIENLDEYIESLYLFDEAENLPLGTNIIPNGDFSKNLDGWWIIKDVEDVSCEAVDGEVIVESKTNFKLDVFSDVFIEKPGKYKLSVEYRGTNTTDVRVALFLRAISFDGEKNYETIIYPSDVRYVLHSIDEIDLPMGRVQLGITMDTPPITGKFRNFSLIKLD